MILLLVLLLLGGCAGAGLQPPAPPGGDLLTAGQPEYRVMVHRWERGDNFRYTLEQYFEMTIGERIERRRHTRDIRYSARRATMQDGVQVGVFIDDLELVIALFDRTAGLIDTTTSPESVSLVVPLMRFWSVFAKPWDGRTLRLDDPHTLRLPRRTTLALDLRGELPPQFLDDWLVTTRLAGYRDLAGRRTAVITSTVANVVRGPASIRLWGRDVKADHVTNESTYDVDTSRGFPVSAYSVSRLTGRVGEERFTYRQIDALSLRP